MSEMNQNIHYFEGKGDLTFNQNSLATSFSGGTAYGKDVADFNLDGFLDVLIGGSSASSVHIYEGNFPKRNCGCIEYW